MGRPNEIHQGSTLGFLEHATYCTSCLASCDTKNHWEHPEREEFLPVGLEKGVIPAEMVATIAAEEKKKNRVLAVELPSS
jgi:hypothetical protein